MYQSLALGLLSLAAGTAAQQIGTNTAEVHPKITYSTCTKGGTCSTTQSSIVLDANWRWTHTTTGTTNCYTGSEWDATLCPDGATCAKNCAIDGADYTGTYGITASGNSVALQLVTTDQYGTNVGSRVYVMDSTDKKYQLFKMTNMEITMDVDVSKLGCGLNGAVYFSSMDADGGMSKYANNKAGAAYGTGYCDSQCPQDIKFINGEANSVGWASSGANSGTGKYGSCCPEMDLWEANSISAALTPHPCGSTLTQTRCTGSDCGNADGTRYEALCDKDGCDFNSYRWKNHTYYGPGLTVDTKKPFTVVTQFITDDNTATGTLTAIKRFYVQGGKTIPNSYTNVKGIDSTNAITKKFCNQQKKITGNTNSFKTKGGLATMGKALQTGMVLVLSLWDDTAVNMLWLDSTYPVAGGHVGDKRGTCATTSGKPADVEKNAPMSTVVYSNIKYGPIGSTFKST